MSEPTTPELLDAYERTLEVKLAAEVLLESIRLKLAQRQAVEILATEKRLEPAPTSQPKLETLGQCQKVLRPWGRRTQETRCTRKATRGGYCWAHTPKTGVA